MMGNLKEMAWVVKKKAWVDKKKART